MAPSVVSRRAAGRKRLEENLASWRYRRDGHDHTQRIRFGSGSGPREVGDRQASRDKRRRIASKRDTPEVQTEGESEDSDGSLGGDEDSDEEEASNSSSTSSISLSPTSSTSKARPTITITSTVLMQLPTISATPTSTSTISTTSTVPTPSTSTSAPQSPPATTMTPLMSVGVIPFVPQVSSQRPRKGVDVGPTTLSSVTMRIPTTTSSVSIVTPVFATLPSVTPESSNNSSQDKYEEDKEDDHNDDDRFDKYHDRPRPDDAPRGLDPTAQHVLISVGSIGTFILVCFIGWIVWRTMKRPRKHKANGDSGVGRSYRRRLIPNWLVTRSPFLWPRGWHNVDDQQGIKGVPPMYQEKGDLGMAADVGFTKGNLPPDAGKPITSLHQPMPSFGTVDAAQFAAMSRDTQDGTRRSDILDFYYNESDPAGRPSGTYDAAQRQVNRASALSSLSSGFGDGDIIVPDSYLTPPPPPKPTAAAATQRQSGHRSLTRFSWLSRGRRDTVYTQSSEDSPPRFRSVMSWVNQQKGRVDRAQHKSADATAAGPAVPPLPGHVGVPGIHNPPAEVNFGMMLDDGQAPRPVAEVINGAQRMAPQS